MSCMIFPPLPVPFDFPLARGSFANPPPREFEFEASTSISPPMSGSKNLHPTAETPPPWPLKTWVTNPPFVSHTLTIPSALPVAKRVFSVSVPSSSTACELEGMGGETERLIMGA